MHALVTGGAGFIGSHLVNKLLNLGSKVTIIDNLSTGLQQNIHSDANFINLNLADLNFDNKIPDDTTHIFHLAAQSSAEISFEDPVYDLRINTLSTLKLLQLSLKMKIKKFLYTSSMNVYGDIIDKPISENHILKPSSFYGVCKLASENYIRVFSGLGLNGVCLRLFNVYGPGQNLNNLKQGMISIYLSYILNEKPIIVKGDLNRFRDFVFIDDVIDAFIQSVNTDILYDSINICSGTKTTVNDLIKMIIKAFDLNDYPIEVKEGTPGDIYGIYGNPFKSKRIINWISKTSLKEGLNKTVELYKKNN